MFEGLENADACRGTPMKEERGYKNGGAFKSATMQYVYITHFAGIGERAGLGRSAAVDGLRSGKEVSD